MTFLVCAVGVFMGYHLIRHVQRRAYRKMERAILEFAPSDEWTQKVDQMWAELSQAIEEQEKVKRVLDQNRIRTANRQAVARWN